MMKDYKYFQSGTRQQSIYEYPIISKLKLVYDLSNLNIFNFLSAVYAINSQLSTDKTHSRVNKLKNELIRKSCGYWCKDFTVTLFFSQICIHSNTYMKVYVHGRVGVGVNII